MPPATIHASPPARSTLLHPFALSRRPAEPVAEFLLIPFGDVKVERPVSGGDFVFTREHADAAMRWFESIGRKLAIDYEHQSFARLNTRTDGLRPAAGWVGGLEIRDDGLWATNVTWTDRARELLASGEYRYFSPVIFWADEDYSRLAALGPVALTNDPAMRGVQALAARTADAGAMESSPPLPAPSDSPSSDEQEPVGDDAALAEIALLRRQLVERDADAFVERGERAGKIVGATRDDWREEYVRDAKAAEAKLTRSPALRPPGRVLPVDSRGRAIGATPATGYELYRSWGVEAADLSAYDRALAAGRVK